MGNLEELLLFGATFTAGCATMYSLLSAHISVRELLVDSISSYYTLYLKVAIKNPLDLRLGVRFN